MTSRRPRHARLVKRRRRLLLRPRAQPRVTTRQTHSSRRRRPARHARHRLSRSRMRSRHRPRGLRRRLPQPRRPSTHRPRRQLRLLLRPSRLRRRHRARRRTCRRLALRRRARCHRRVPRRRCRRRHGGWSPPAARNQRGRSCRRPGVRQRARRNRPRRQGQRRTKLPDLPCRRRLLLVCRCHRNLPMADRSRPRRRRLARDPASRSPRRRALPAHQLAAGARIARVPPAGSGVPRAAVTVRTVAGQAAGARTRERRHPLAAVRADPPAALVREAREEHREAVHEAGRAAAVVASARNCSLSSSPPIRRLMRPFPKAKSSSSGDRRLKKWPPG